MKRIPTIVLVAVAFAVIVVAIFNMKNEPVSENSDQNNIEQSSNDTAKPTATIPTTVPPQKVTLEGVWECLPHKNPDQPHTMECALGIAVDRSDAHYAIDLNLMSASPVDYPTGTHIRVQGVVTPLNQLSSDHWQKYPIDGIISATVITKI